MKKLLMLLLGIMTFSPLIFAQNTAETPLPDATPPNPSIVNPLETFPLDPIGETAYEPSPVSYSPDIFGAMRADLLPGSFSQNAAWNLQNNFGFSLGAQEGYYFSEFFREDPLSGANSSKQSSSITSLSASVFTNFARGKSAMHLDYGAGYSFYPHRQNSADYINHSATASYMYRINNRTQFQMSDSFYSSSNDPLRDIFSINSSFGNYLSGSYYFDFFTPQRYIRNTASSSLGSDVTGKGTNLSIFGSYTNYWYDNQDPEINTLRDYYSAMVGIGVSQRITSWLSLGSTYSLQLNNDLRDRQTHRVEVGRFQFDLSSSVQIYASGGVEFYDDGYGDDGYQTRVSARTGISYSTQVNRLYADYSRTMRSVSGFQRLLPSDIVTVGLGQPMGNRVNLRVMGYYQQSSDLRDSGRLTVYQGLVSMEYALVSGLFASVNYTYRYQKNSIDSLSGIPHFERSTISAGLQYAWPSGRSRN